MIGLDTNVLVRYIMQDDEDQAMKATQLMESLKPDVPGFIPLVVTVELYWVLTSAYELSRDQITQVFEKLIVARELVIENKDQVARALRIFSISKADFPDCLIERSANAAGCTAVMTFDVKASKKCGMTLIS